MKVAFVFHVASGQIHEVELIADPEVLSTLVITRTRTAKETIPNENNDL